MKRATMYDIPEGAFTFQSFVNSILNGSLPQHTPFSATFGEWNEYAHILHEAYEAGYEYQGKVGAINLAQINYTSLLKDTNFQTLMQMVSEQAMQQGVTLPVESAPKLPEMAAQDYSKGKEARVWLDDFIEWSTYWSPRGHYLFHESMGLFLLSLLTARRLKLPIDDGFYPSLYICFAADSGKYAKTTTTKIAKAIVRELGLSHLTISPKSSPQAFFQESAGHVPDDWESLGAQVQEETLTRIAFAGKRSMFMDELGEMLSSMMQQNSVNHGWVRIFLEWAGCPPEDDNTTIGRGRDIVREPYLSFLGCMTIDHVQALPTASSPWMNGFFGRIALITPPPNEWVLTEKPSEAYTFPEKVMEPLRHFVRTLPTPHVGEPEALLNGKGKPTGKFAVERDAYPVQECTWDEGAMNGYKNYGKALFTLVNTDTSIPRDLHGNYVRFADKALAIAMLLSWMDNGGHMTLAHWIAAQEVAERWRVSLHECYGEVNGIQTTYAGKIEKRILNSIQRSKKGLTAREVQQNVGGGLTAKQVLEYLQYMQIIGTIVPVPVAAGKGGTGVKIVYVTPDSPLAQQEAVQELV